MRLGYFRKAEIDALRASGIRAWANKEPIRLGNRGDRWLTYVEPAVIELQKTYRKWAQEGRVFAGMAEWEFILAALPAK